MQVDPCAGCCRIACRSSSLRKSGNNTERHFCACAVDDRFVECLGNGDTDCCEQLVCKVKVGILKDCIADCEIAAYLVAVDLDIVESERQLVKRCAHLRPYAFRNRAHDVLAGLTAYALKVYTACELAVCLNDLTKNRKHNIRNGKTDICQRSLLLNAFARTRKECFYIFVSEQCASFLLADGI